MTDDPNWLRTLGQMKPALFLDRDGIINVDVGYVSRKEDFQWCDGIFELGQAAYNSGYHLVVVTNQSGIGRGYYTDDDFRGLTTWMCAELAQRGAPIAGVYHCPYHPEAVLPEYRSDHPWRKPAPGMILQARQDLGLDLGMSILVGNQPTDISAGTLAGVGTTVYVGSESDVAHMQHAPTVVVSDVRGALEWFLKR